MWLYSNTCRSKKKAAGNLASWSAGMSKGWPISHRLVKEVPSEDELPKESESPADKGLLGVVSRTGSSVIHGYLQSIIAVHYLGDTG